MNSNIAPNFENGRQDSDPGLHEARLRRIEAVDWDALTRGMLRRDPVNGMDAVQEIAAKVLEGKFDRYDIAEMRPVVWRSAFNVLADIRRRAARTSSFDNVVVERSTGTDDTDVVVRAVALAAVLQEAPEDVMTIVTIMHDLDLDVDEAVAVAGLSRSQGYRRRAQLRESCNDLDPRRPSRRQPSRSPEQLAK